ncbi:MAG: hypothetical protein ACT4PW_06935 [Acidimicrobiia bacterium]
MSPSPRPRWWAAAGVGVLCATVAGCGLADGGGGSGGRLEGPPQTLEPGPSTSRLTVPGKPELDIPVGAGPGPEVPAPSAPTGPASTGPGPAPAPVLDGAVEVGFFAPAVLRPDLSTRVLVEVRNQPGAAPAGASLDHLQGVLAAVTGKPVTVTSGPGIAGGARDWSDAAVRAEASAGTAVSADGTVVLRLLFLEGVFEGSAGVLGVAVRGDTAAIFSDAISASGGLLSGSGPIENAVVTHEVGHLLGLVDVYRQTGRADPDHPGHSSNPGSVMYWAVESSLIGSLLGEFPPTEFDQADLADLAAIRSGA